MGHRALTVWSNWFFTGPNWDLQERLINFLNHPPGCFLMRHGEVKLPRINKDKKTPTIY